MPIVEADTLVEKLRPLAESFEERRRRGEAGRAYVEQVRDIDKLADRLIAVYESSRPRSVDQASAYSRFTLTPWTRARFHTYSGSA